MQYSYALQMKVYQWQCVHNIVQAKNLLYHMFPKPLTHSTWGSLYIQGCMASKISVPWIFQSCTPTINNDHHLRHACIEIQHFNVNSYLHQSLNKSTDGRKLKMYMTSIIPYIFTMDIRFGYSACMYFMSIWVFGKL